jgi:DegV family protein with EDD domain
MARTVVVTDSTACLPPEFTFDRGIAVVPLHVIIGADDYEEGLDVEATPAFVAEALREWKPVSTSRPAPAAFLAAYRLAATSGAEQILSVHISAEMSGTYDAAVLAAGESPVPVRVVDARQVAMGTGFAVRRAAEALTAGADLDEAAEVARRTGEQTVSLFYVDTLEYLKRGGRIGAAAALVGSALSVKPILEVEDGRIGTREKVRTSARALARLESLAVAAAEGHEVEVAIGHLASPERATSLAETLAETLEIEVSVTEVGAVIGAHVGPGLVGVVVAPRTSG